MNNNKLLRLTNEKWFWYMLLLASMLLCGVFVGRPIRFALSAMIMGAFCVYDILRDSKIKKVIQEKVLKYKVYIVINHELVDNNKIRISYQNRDNSSDKFSSTYSLEDFNRYKECGMLKSEKGSLQGMCISDRDNTVFDIDCSPYEAASKKFGVCRHQLLLLAVAFVCVVVAIVPMDY